MIKKVLKRILSPIKNIFFLFKWRRNNKHNTTVSINHFHIENVRVGKGTYGPIEVLYDSGAGKLTVGNYCSIAKNVKFFLGGGHNYHRISTFPFQTKIYQGRGNSERDVNTDIIVEDDVWIGYDCIILPGAKIGKGSVIGARSVVTGTIPPYSVYVGNKVIKKRFSDDIESIIVTIDFACINHKAGDSYEQYCDREVTAENVLEIKAAFEDGSIQ